MKELNQWTCREENDDNSDFPETLGLFAPLRDKNGFRDSTEEDKAERDGAEGYRYDRASN